MDNLVRDKIYNQIQNEYGKVMFSYTTHLKMGKLLKQRNEMFKVTQIDLSAISTTSLFIVLFGEHTAVTIIGTVVSVILVIINSYLKEIDIAGDSKSHFITAQELHRVINRYLSLLTDFELLSIEQIRSKRDELFDDTEEIYRRSLDTNQKAYEVARKSLSDKEEQFFTQDELNKMLPENLRKDNYA